MHELTSPAVLSNSREHALYEIGNFLRDGGYRFTTVTPATHARVSSRYPQRLARNLREIFGWSQPFNAGLLPARLFELMQSAGVLESVDHAWRSSIRYSTFDDSLYVHSAYPTIAADAVFFGPDTYRFCGLIQRFLNRSQQPLRRVADIGCGSGAGAIVVAQARPSAEVLALDINQQALGMTRVNAALAGAFNVATVYSNLLDCAGGEFDLIVANPPYLMDIEKRAYRHGGGMRGAELSLAMMEAALSRLAVGGSLLLYTGVAIVAGVDDFLQAASRRLAHLGMRWSYRELDPDVFGEELSEPAYADVERIAAVALTVTRDH